MIVMRMVALSLLFASPVAWGSTLSWDPDTAVDLAGYRIYRCSQQPCGRAQGTATLLSTVGKVTTYNIGAPATTQYFVITAFDTSNNESADSNVATYTPAAPPPPTQPPVAPPPTPQGLRLF